MKEIFNVADDIPFQGEEKREFLRLPYEYPLKFAVCRKGLLKQLEIGTTRNVSQNGMLFRARRAPAVSAILLIETDLNTLANCIEVEDALLELNGRIMGKVVRVKRSEDGPGYEVAVQFIRVGEEWNDKVTKAIETASDFTNA